MSGLLSLSIDTNEPQLTGTALSDNVTGIYTAVAILGGLVHRERHNTGLHVETNQLAATMALIGHSFVRYFESGEQPGVRGSSMSNHSFVLRCQDEKLIIIHLSSPPKFWQALLKATGSTTTIGSDPRYGDRRGRTANYDALRSDLGEIFVRQPRAYWLATLEEHDVPFSSVNTLAEVVADPQVSHLGTMFDVKHPVEGITRVVGRPIWYDGDDGQAEAFAPPTLGEHTEAILSSLKSKS
jgi:crotonobetainyl-CoA:carnitine CoA-transferase CaiB-like acyl-CoA transferase